MNRRQNRGQTQRPQTDAATRALQEQMARCADARVRRMIAGPSAQALGYALSSRIGAQPPITWREPMVPTSLGTRERIISW